MINARWRKRFSILQNRLYLYPAPEPMPRTRLFWLCMGLVTLAVLCFSAYFITYLTTQHDAFLTNAEDLGIMDQALWNTIHGPVLHQTICNIIADTNCYSPDGIMRFAIHVEPILFPVSLLYWLWPGPKTLLTLQTLVVAVGAYPAFWLARLRLRSDLAGVAIALLYLLYPALQQAVAYDFHAVTFTASLLLFTLYFLYTRRTAWLFGFAILSMACKEEIPLVIIMFGLWSMVFQRRWRSGLALVVIAVAWFIIATKVVMPHFSPTGEPLLAGRYRDLGDGPVQIIANIVLHPRAFLHKYIFGSAHYAYLRVLFLPAAFLPLLAPWVLVLALPSLAVNLLSSNIQQYSGLFQYNAEIVPVLIFATIEALVLLLWIVQSLFAFLQKYHVRKVQNSDRAAALSLQYTLSARVFPAALLSILLVATLTSSIRLDYSFFGKLPFSSGFEWPQVTAHQALAQRFIAMIPQDASVSAQSRLVPHMSHREKIYLFPYQMDKADYIFLDVTSDIYPYFGSQAYINAAKKVLLGNAYGIVAAQDGYLLLKRGLPSPGVSPYSAIKPGAKFNPGQTYQVLPNLPEGFCSNVDATSQAIKHPVQATFSASDGSVDLLGFDSSMPASTLSRSKYMQLTTYWRINKPIATPLQELVIFTDRAGREYLASTDVPAVYWCQTNTWQPGKIIKLTSKLFSPKNSVVPNGLVHVSVALLPLAHPSSTIMNIQPRLSVRAGSATSNITSPRDTRALPLMPLTIVP